MFSFLIHTTKYLSIYLLRFFFATACDVVIGICAIHGSPRRSYPEANIGGNWSSNGYFRNRIQAVEYIVQVFASTVWPLWWWCETGALIRMFGVTCGYGDELAQLTTLFVPPLPHCWSPPSLSLLSMCPAGSSSVSFLNSWKPPWCASLTLNLGHAPLFPQEMAKVWLNVSTILLKADIMWMHQEGLLLEFSTHEIVGLIRALFSDSSLRAKNIDIITSSSRRGEWGQCHRDGWAILFFKGSFNVLPTGIEMWFVRYDDRAPCFCSASHLMTRQWFDRHHVVGSWIKFRPCGLFDRRLDCFDDWLA